MAVDAPGFLEGHAYALYWQAYRQELGEVNTFGGIQALYERYGPNVTLNDSTVFLNTINSASIQGVNKVLESVNVMPTPIAVGFYITVLGYILLIVALSSGLPRAAEFKPAIELN